MHICRGNSSRVDTESDLVVLMTWGGGGCGQLGHGDLADHDTPEIVQFLRTKIPVKVTCGAAHTSCILNLSGKSDIRQLYMWGLGCAIGTQDSPNMPTPTQLHIPAIGAHSEDFPLDVACGSLFTVILSENGYLHTYGKLPSNNITSRIENYSDKDAKSISAGGNHMALLVGRKWIADEDSDKCMNCHKDFVFAFRGRHHCRSCGGLFCDDCTKKRAAVLQFGYHEKVRVCEPCFLKITNG